MLLKNLINEPFDDIKGQNSVKQQLKSALLAKRHIIIIGPAGVGKTTLAKNVAKLLPELAVNACPYHCLPSAPVCPECRAHTTQKTKKISGSQRFVRIQGSPDLTVEDLLGDIDPVKALKSGALSIEAFTPGKIFKANNGVLFFDELNRCPEKLQNALLQVLEEGTATLGSYDVEIPARFIFIGTMNPQDSSTEKLSDVLLDRFDIIHMSYPETHAVESAIVVEKGLKSEATVPVRVLDFMVGFVRLLRENEKLEKVPGVRGSIGLYERSQTNALLEGRTAVTFDDVRAVAVSVLAHRIKLKPSAQYIQSPEELVSEELEKFSSAKRGGDG
ncbi:MAG: ATP-binding protein [Candidatus Woesearchaeota archaeon]|nr:ATP-binding protein [Candidatus Woesearchaeota archaeon]